jgi:hypothetical protein
VRADRGRDGATVGLEGSGISGIELEGTYIGPVLEPDRVDVDGIAPVAGQQQFERVATTAIDAAAILAAAAALGAPRAYLDPGKPRHR